MKAMIANKCPSMTRAPNQKPASEREGHLLLSNYDLILLKQWSRPPNLVPKMSPKRNDAVCPAHFVSKYSSYPVDRSRVSFPSLRSVEEEEYDYFAEDLQKSNTKLYEPRHQ